ncbi:MAG: hypothetical protein JXX28_04410 [Deltaproteobacteria bacterium]|nr:hypothetical protein [Deltaproteobacteria bacterium]
MDFAEALCWAALQGGMPLLDLPPGDAGTCLPAEGASLRPWGELTLGTQRSPRRLGAVDAGPLSAQAGALVSARRGSWSARATGAAALALSAEGAGAAIALREWDLGWDGRHASLHLGQYGRAIGPGRFGNLIVSDRARPLPGADGTLISPLPHLGTVGARVAGGWIPEERRGPDRPGWLLMAARWEPIPALELGAVRRSIFAGGEDGVPAPVDPWQVLLPTHPHVADDPDRQLADTDEAAALHARLTLTPAQWSTGGPEAVSVYVEHGGEDVITRQLGPLPYPGLAGVANLYGASVRWGPWRAVAEGAVIEDDLFRWYTGHRLYHDGWTLGGASLGHPRGGDARSWQAAVGHGEARWVSVEVEQVRRVLVADRIDDAVIIFPQEELRRELRLIAGRLDHPSGVWLGALGAARVWGRDFLPGTREDQVSLRLTWAAAPRTAPTCR